MSRNYELLQQAGKERELFQPDLEVRDSTTETFSIERNDLGLEGLEREEVTKLVQRVFLLPGRDVSRVVMFSSAEKGVGCTWVTANAAMVLASLVPGSVCVIDANLRSPDLHTQFGFGNNLGLAGAVRQAGPVRDFTQRLGANLWLMSSGSDDSSSQTILSSDRMSARIAELRNEFDYVLVDSPALNLYSDAVVLARHCDGLVLVLKANSSRRETVQKALKDLSAANVRVLGAVLNQRTFPLPEAIYKRL